MSKKQEERKTSFTTSQDITNATRSNTSGTIPSKTNTSKANVTQVEEA